MAALIQKFDAAATTKTHGAVDGTIMDALMPTVPLADTTSNFIRAGAYFAMGWLGRGKKETGTFSL